MGGNWFGGNWFGGNWFGGNWAGGSGGGDGTPVFAMRADRPSCRDRHNAGLQREVQGTRNGIRICAPWRSCRSSWRRGS